MAKSQGLDLLKHIAERIILWYNYTNAMWHRISKGENQMKRKGIIAILVISLFTVICVIAATLMIVYLGISKLLLCFYAPLLGMPIFWLISFFVDLSFPWIEIDRNKSQIYTFQIRKEIKSSFKNPNLNSSINLDEVSEISLNKKVLSLTMKYGHVKKLYLGAFTYKQIRQIEQYLRESISK